MNRDVWIAPLLGLVAWLGCVESSNDAMVHGQDGRAAPALEEDISAEAGSIDVVRIMDVGNARDAVVFDDARAHELVDCETDDDIASLLGLASVTPRTVYPTDAAIWGFSDGLFSEAALSCAAQQTISMGSALYIDYSAGAAYLSKSGELHGAYYALPLQCHGLMSALRYDERLFLALQGEGMPQEASQILPLRCGAHGSNSDEPSDGATEPAAAGWTLQNVFDLEWAWIFEPTTSEPVLSGLLASYRGPDDAEATFQMLVYRLDGAAVDGLSGVDQETVGTMLGGAQVGDESVGVFELDLLRVPFVELCDGGCAADATPAHFIMEETGPTPIAAREISAERRLDGLSYAVWEGLGTAAVALHNCDALTLGLGLLPGAESNQSWEEWASDRVAAWDADTGPVRVRCGPWCVQVVNTEAELRSALNLPDACETDVAYVDIRITADIAGLGEPLVVTESPGVRYVSLRGGKPSKQPAELTSGCAEPAACSHVEEWALVEHESDFVLRLVDLSLATGSTEGSTITGVRAAAGGDVVLENVHLGSQLAPLSVGLSVSDGRVIARGGTQAHGSSAALFFFNSNALLLGQLTAPISATMLAEASRWGAMRADESLVWMRHVELESRVAMSVRASQVEGLYSRLLGSAGAFAGVYVTPSYGASMTSSVWLQASVISGFRFVAVFTEDGSLTVLYPANLLTEDNDALQGGRFGTVEVLYSSLP